MTKAFGAGLSLPVHPPPSWGRWHFTDKGLCAGNARFFAISKLTHDQQNHFAPTSAVCLISGFHSELEEKVLSLDNRERMGNYGPKEKHGCYS